jgi:pyrroloquinoline quinone biosynthesis protein B
MQIVVLGSAAGGGFPQWNSNAAACQRARSGEWRARPRTQASIAVSATGRRWYLLNAAPDLAAQIAATRTLWPREGLRSSPIAGAILTGSDVDAIAGLLTLRERHPFTIYATAEVHAVIASNPIFRVLSPDCVERRRLALEERTSLISAADPGGELAVRAFAVPGKVALWLEREGRDPGRVEDGNTVGLEITEPASGAHFFFIPGCAALTSPLLERLRGAPLVFFDGTLWRDDEMIQLGIGTKTGKRMGHLSMSGEEGVIAAFRDLGIARKVFIHINNTNPVLLEDAPERSEAERSGWTIAYDGMELAL